MGTFDDINLERTEVWDAPPPRQGYRRVVIAGAVVLLVLAGGFAWWMRTRPTPSPEIERMAAARPPTRPAPAARPPVPTTLPALDALDPLMRSLIGEVSASPLLSKWLGTENLARQIVVLVEGAAGDGLPFRFLTHLRPAGEFSVVTRNGRTTIAPDSYARYDAMAGVIAAIDPATVARVYRTLSPRLEEAHGELGQGDRTFDQTLGDSLRRLAETPIPDGPVAVTPRGGLYGFADPRLEALSPAQKLLLRSGPANARRVQTQLSAIAAALATSGGGPAPTP